MAARSYDMFNGFQAQRRNDEGGNRNMKAVDWNKQSLVPGKWSVPDMAAIKKASGFVAPSNAAHPVKSMTNEEVAAWRESHTVSICGEDCPPPITTFDQLTMVPSYLQKKLSAQGFQSPTIIQSQAWPVLLAGRDFVGVAKTGSGKTLAFIVPALAHIALQDPLRPGDGPMVIVLAPTRELAQQIEQETLKVLPQTVRCGCIYGGTPKGPQLGMLRQGIHILVATPGRLIDFLEIKRVNLFRVTYLVLDEADRMLDMGFEPQVKAICGQIRPDRQTLMFSATWPKEVQRLAATFQKNWIRVNIGSMELLANKDVTQHFILTTEAEKFEQLKKLMANHRKQRILIFCKTKRTADQLEYQLKRLGTDVMAIHGDKEQSQREFILERFRKDPHLCLVATDVAARGLDIKQLEVVINYDFPMQIDDYVHRIGRTGRAGAKGQAFTLITKREDQLTPSNVQQLIGIIQRAEQEVPEWLFQWGKQGGGVHILKRNRNMMHGGRNPPMRYGGGAASSFDPRQNASPTGYFGLGKVNDGRTAVFGTRPTKSAHYEKFSDSDDEPSTKRQKN